MEGEHLRQHHSEHVAGVRWVVESSDALGDAE
jgi:hypothetical protein